MRFYHRTTPERAAAILATGATLSRENRGPGLYVSDRRDGAAAAYGSAVVVVTSSAAELDDEYPDGERHFWIPASKIERLS